MQKAIRKTYSLPLKESASVLESCPAAKLESISALRSSTRLDVFAMKASCSLDLERLNSTPRALHTAQKTVALLPSLAQIQPVRRKTSCIAFSDETTILGFAAKM